MQVVVTDRDGAAATLDVPPGTSLALALVEKGYDIDMTCGGVGVCATCHVYVADDWIGRLPAPDHDEADTIAGLVQAERNSRLSCQVALEPALGGLSVVVAPKEA